MSRFDAIHLPSMPWVASRFRRRSALIFAQEILAQMDRDVDLRGRFIRLNSPESMDIAEKVSDSSVHLVAKPHGCDCESHPST